MTSTNLGVKMIQMNREEETYAGLKVLEELDGLFVEQEFEIIETFTTGLWEQPNRYMVYDRTGKVKLFYAKEKTNCCWRQCCSEHRPFNIKLYDHTGEKDKLALQLKRPFRCCGWALLPCCQHSVGVHYMIDDDGEEVSGTSEDTLISKVQVPFGGGWCWPTLHINDKHGNKQGDITGPFCCVADCCGADFDVHDNNGTNIGEIKKMKVAGLKDLAVEIMTDSDKFGITFPKELPPQMKLAILAATFQLDFWFFEDNRNFCQCRLCDLYCCGWACPCFPKMPFCCNDNKDKDKNKKGGAPTMEQMER